MRSMTGYAELKKEFDGFSVNAVVKSINGKYLDVVIKTEETYQYLESEIVSTVKSKVKRGRVNLFITVEIDSEKCKVEVNEEKIRPILEQVEKLQKEFPAFNFTAPLSVFLSNSNGFIEKNISEDFLEKIAAGIIRTVNETLDNFNKMREKEGEFLKRDFRIRLEKISDYVKLIEERRQGFFESQLERFRKLIGGLVKEGDENRIMIEAGILADKLDISEEITRLKSHLETFGQTMDEAGDSIGKKLDFILQEMMREINTIGSKGKDREISRFVIETKTEIEKIREQVQNIE